MTNKNSIIIGFLALLLCGINQNAVAQDEYGQAVQEARAGDKDSAFMRFHDIADDVNSQHREQALFAVGEYYFLTSNYYDAFSSLKQFLTDYPNSKTKPFALLLLLQVSKFRGNEEAVEEIEKQILGLKQVILLFKNTKECKYKSAFGTNYRLTYYIDKLEFYLNGKLLAQIPY